MRRVHTLTKKEYEELENGFKNGEKHHFRIRCQAILLSNDGLPVAEISSRLKKDKDTVYSLLKRYGAGGIASLHNKPGQGPKATLGNLSKGDERILKDAVDNEPQNLNRTSDLLSRELGLEINKWKLIQYIKKNSTIVGAGSANGSGPCKTGQSTT